MNAFEQLERNHAPGPLFEAEGDDVRADGPFPVRLFAYYLPQFHPIAQNDAWWGKGFTEWTNVTKALPRFAGHYQPHLPADLGFYDLRLPETLRAQVALAKRYGIAGFCFHWYWFSGERLLERPLDLFLEHRDIDFPFFINWANENWTRRWDGAESAVLIHQRHRPEDVTSIADAFLDIMKDPRYLRVDGRPVLMVYRASALPDAARTITRWRRHFHERGENDPYILMPLAFDEFDPLEHGMDAAVQFPPHFGGAHIERPARRVNFFERTHENVLYEYGDIADRACAWDEIDFPIHRCVCPGWDNEARKPRRGLVLVGSTPRRYGHWLGRAIRDTIRDREPLRRLLFVNAWNEWAEGAHLEPDRHFGHAYLRETCRALVASRDPATLDGFIAARDEPASRREPASTARALRAAVADR